MYAKCISKYSSKNAYGYFKMFIAFIKKLITKFS
jgi:hypothetical protein